MGAAWRPPSREGGAVDLEGSPEALAGDIGSGWLTPRWVKDVVQGLGALHCALHPIPSLPGGPCLLIVLRVQPSRALGF